MANLFFYDNLIKTATVTASSEHPNFPATNVQTSMPPEAWRSNYGPGSGWGNFVIMASVNDRLDFSEGGSELHALLTPGVYTVDTLCAHLKAQMDAVGAITYTWTYNESGTNVNKFTVAGTAPFALHWNSGANKARSIAGTIGFDDSSDDYGGGISTFTADWIRIHSVEWLRFDLGSVQSIYGIFIKNHNLQVGTATLAIDFFAANNWTITETQAITVQADITGYVWSTPKSYQWGAIIIHDITNPDGYVKVGIVGTGGRFAPTRDFETGYSKPLEDPSILKYSSGGQLSTIIKDVYRTGDFNYPNSPDIASFETMFQSVGLSRSLFFIEDSANLLTTLRYGRLSKYDPVHTHGTNWNISMSFEDAR